MQCEFVHALYLSCLVQKQTKKTKKQKTEEGKGPQIPSSYLQN